MFDIAWSELALIAAVALVVIGPKDLPKVMRTLGQWVRKARLLAAEFQHNVEDMVRQAELDDLRRKVQSVNAQSVTAQVEDMVGAKDIKESLRLPPDAVAGATPPPSAPLSGEATGPAAEAAGTGDVAAELPEAARPPEIRSAEPHAAEAKR